MNAVVRRRLEMAARVRDFLRTHKTDGVGEGLGLAKLEELIARAETLAAQQLREIIDALEDRYQVAVNIGQSDREVADRMLQRGHQAARLPFIWDRQPWRVI